MSDSGPHQPLPDAVFLAAHQWTVRMDRGLSAAESIEYELWLAADPAHGAALRQCAAEWSLLEKVPEDFARRELAGLARRRHRRRYLALGLTAAAAALAVGWGLWNFQLKSQPSPLSALAATGPRAVTLADGTLVKLNAGAEVVEDFDAQLRRVRLARGEAHFTVVKDAARPFVVEAGALSVRAVGTAFNVNLRAAQVEVVVTEGTVKLTSEQERSNPEEAMVTAGQRGVFPAALPGREAGVPAITVSTVDTAEMTRTLAWQDSLISLGGATLAELADEFERRTGQRVVFADPQIAQLRAGGRLRAADSDGFANLLATTFDLEVERAADGAWVLRKKNSKSR